MNFMHEQNKTPGSGRDFREFLFRLCKVAYTLGWCRLFVSFQPFADKVANNTCQYRDNECNNSFHGVSPPLYRKGSRLLYIITSYKIVQSVLLFYSLKLDKLLLQSHRTLFFSEYKSIPHTENTRNNKPFLC